MLRKKVAFFFLSFSIAVMMGIATYINTANAATDSGTSDVQFEIVAAIEISVPSSYDFGQVDPIGSPYEKPDAITINVKSNSDWSLDAQANSEYFTGGSNDKPFSDLEIKDEDSSSWNQLSNTSAIPVQDGSQTTNSGTDVGVDYKLTIDWDDDVGSYSGTITYTGSTT